MLRSRRPAARQPDHAFLSIPVPLPIRPVWGLSALSPALRGHKLSIEIHSPPFVMSPLVQPKSPASGKRLKKAITIGVIAFLVQFGISEILFQISNRSVGSACSETLFTTSNILCWPAELILMEVEESNYVAALESLLSHPQKHSPDLIEQARLLIEQQDNNDDQRKYLSDCYNLLDQAGINAFPSESTAYAIYIGTCMVWASLIGILVFIFTESSPQLTARDFTRIR